MVNYVSAYEPASSETDETTLVGQTIYKFGINDTRTIPLGMNDEWSGEKLEDISNHYYTLANGIKPMDIITAHYLPINLTGAYRTFGYADNTVADTTRKMSAASNLANKKRYACVEKIASLKPHVSHGSLFNDFSIRWDKDTGWVCNEIGSGLKNHAPDWALETPVYPSAARTNTTDVFDVFNYLKWGADGSEVAIPKLQIVEAHIFHAIAKHTGDNNYYSKLSAIGAIGCTITATFHSCPSALYDDYHAGTPRSLLMKGSKSKNSACNFEFDDEGDTVRCMSLQPSKTSGQTDLWTAVFWLSNVKLSVTDYVEDTFYS